MITVDNFYNLYDFLIENDMIYGDITIEYNVPVHIYHDLIKDLKDKKDINPKPMQDYIKLKINEVIFKINKI